MKIYSFTLPHYRETREKKKAVDLGSVTLNVPMFDLDSDEAYSWCFVALYLGLQSIYNLLV